MAIRFYLMPYTEQIHPLTAVHYRGPKYVAWGEITNPDAIASLNGAVGQFLKYGEEPTCLAALDLNSTQQNALAALPDVTVVPANLDNQIGANLATVQGILEGWNLPSDDVSAAMTYRQLLRAIAFIFYVFQRFAGKKAGRIFSGTGFTLATTLGELPQGARDNLRAAAEERGIDYTGLTGTSTLRQCLRRIGQQQGGISMLGVAI